MRVGPPKTIAFGPAGGLPPKRWPDPRVRAAAAHAVRVSAEMAAAALALRFAPAAGATLCQPLAAFADRCRKLGCGPYRGI